jgi:hypothetical protein
VADVAETVARHRGGDARLHSPPRGVDELGRLARHRSDGPGPSAVGVPAADDAADVDADQVAVGKAAAGRWDAVDDLVVDAGADRAGERRVRAVALEGGDGPGVADHALGDQIQLAGRHPRTQLGANDLQDAGQDLPGLAHARDLGGAFDGDRSGAAHAHPP